MSNYTQEEIEEMRKRLPFKAVVWDNEDNPYSLIVAHIFDDGRCATSVDTWMYFKEVKEPEYVPFDKETIKPLRDEWVKLPEGWIVKILGFNSKGVVFIDSDFEPTFSSYDTAFRALTFADTGKPFGKEMKQ